MDGDRTIFLGEMAGDGSLIADEDKYLEAQARDGEYIFDVNQRVDMGLGITFEVVFGEQGSIVAAAALRNVGKASITGDNVSPLESLIPSEGQVLHELSIPTGAVGRDLFDSLNQWEVQVDEAGASALVPCTCA